MICLKQKSRMAVIVGHEIYGINAHMINFCKRLAGFGFDVWCPNLLKSEKPFDDSEEQAAYHHFMTEVGFQSAYEKVHHLLKEIRTTYDRVILVGFSVGATVAWLCSTDDLMDGLIGFYGSRIRDYTEITPKVPALLLFPEDEPSFDVDALIGILIKKKNVETEKYPAAHGFCNPSSSHYNEALATKAFNRMLGFIRTLDEKEQVQPFIRE